MDRETMRSEARSIFGETDASNSVITDAMLNSWANEAYRFIMTKLENIPITERKYTTANEVTLNSSTLTVDRALFYVQPEDKWIDLVITDIDELVNIDPDWPNATAGKPTHLIRKDTFTAILYPPLDSDNLGVAEGLKTYGMEFDTLSSDADTPNLHLNLHDIFPHYMAYRAFSRLQDPNRAAMELTIVNTILKGMKHMSTKFSDSRGWRVMEQDD